jgi:hypothetical protein
VLHVPSRLLLHDVNTVIIREQRRSWPHWLPLVDHSRRGLWVPVPPRAWMAARGLGPVCIHAQHLLKAFSPSVCTHVDLSTVRTVLRQIWYLLVSRQNFVVCSVLSLERRNGHYMRGRHASPACTDPPTSYFLTPGRRVLPEKLTGSQPVAFTRARHLSLSWTKSIRFMLPMPLLKDPF